MSWIQPNGSIWLLRGVDIDSEYNHTYYFPNLAAQTSFFSNIAATRGMKFEKQSYQRTNRGWLKVNCSYDEVCTYNYLMFNNQRFGGKWFYAFIDSAEYVNEHCTEISYTIDVMQTWYFDYELGQCFVEREHTSTDVIGEHIIPEPIVGSQFTIPNTVTADFKSSLIGNTGDDDYAVLIYYTSGDGRIGTMMDGIYCPFRVRGRKITGSGSQADVTAIETIIDDLVTNNYVIVQIICVPLYLCEWNDSGTITSFKNFPVIKEFTITQDEKFKYANTDRVSVWYRPRNKKLYTAPYSYLLVSDNIKNSNKYQWEYGINNTSLPTRRLMFELYATAYPIFEACLVPSFYKSSKYWEACVPYSGTISLPWTEDSFSRWWAQNGTSFAISSIANIGIMAAGIATGNAAMVAGGAVSSAAQLSGLVNSRQMAASVRGTENSYVSSINNPGVGNGVSLPYAAGKARQYAREARGEQIAAYGQEKIVTSALGNISNSLSTLATSVNLTDKLVGNPTGNNLMHSKGTFGYTFYDTKICGEEAEIIDKYFDMFGYQVNTVKVPNVRGGGTIRPSWNYVKTSQCIVHATNDSGVPQDDEDIIAGVYNHGITFWNTSVQVGNYSANNLPA